MEKEKNVRKGYKAFDKGLKCRGYQFKENEVFEEEKAEICKRGFHYCVNPFEVLEYYDLVNSEGNTMDFAEVEALEEPKTNDDKKYCTRKIKIGASIGIKGFVKACVNFLFEDMKDVEKDKRVISDSGDDSRVAASGNDSQVATSGNDSKVAASGYNSKVALEGESSIGAAIGRSSIIKGKKGCWITLAEYEYSEEKDRYICICVKSAQIDGKILKEDVFYKLENGEFVEVKENE